MDQDEIYTAARQILKDIADAPMSRFTLADMLFLCRNCPRAPGEDPNVIASFDEDCLSELIDIARKVLARGGPTAIN